VDLGHTRPAKSFATDSNPIPHSPAATFDVIKVVIRRIHNDRAARLAGGVLNFCPAECGIDLGRMHRGGRTTGEADHCNGEQDAMTQSAHRKRLSLRRGEIKKKETVCGGAGFWPLAQSGAMSAFGGKGGIAIAAKVGQFQRGSFRLKLREVIIKEVASFNRRIFKL
jgi:hypothetical protein